MGKALRWCLLASLLLVVAHGQREIAVGDTIADPDTEYPTEVKIYPAAAASVPAPALATPQVDAPTPVPTPVPVTVPNPTAQTASSGEAATSTPSIPTAAAAVPGTQASALDPMFNFQPAAASAEDMDSPAAIVADMTAGETALKLVNRQMKPSEYLNVLLGAMGAQPPRVAPSLKSTQRKKRSSTRTNVPNSLARATGSASSSALAQQVALQGATQKQGVSQVCTSATYQSSDNPYGVPKDSKSFMEDTAPPDYNNCSQAFTTKGFAHRPLAIILVKWAPEYYTKESCCKHLEGKPGWETCDCKWANYTYDQIETAFPPQVFERILIDECDGKGSMNRAFFDMSGGAITFGTNDTSEDAARKVNVYGWATLPAMRASPNGKCLNWCGEAKKMLGVEPNSHLHYVCAALYGSSLICDSYCAKNPPGILCTDHCPPGSGITTGCGCGTCYYAWGGQAGCAANTNITLDVGVGAPVTPMWPGTSYIQVTKGIKAFFTHELGHNLGLPHSGALRCNTENGVVDRQAESCRVDNYGDCFSVMGCGGNFNVPNAFRYNMNWLDMRTLMSVLEPSSQQLVIWATNSRRASNPEQAGVQWWSTQLLTVRVSINGTGGSGGVVSMACPCNPRNACPQCDQNQPGFDAREVCQADRTPCCMEPECMVSSGGWYYIEYYRPFSNDYRFMDQPPMIVVRTGGDIPDTNCRAGNFVVAAGTTMTGVPEGGEPKLTWSLVKEGDVFRDDLRGVFVTLNELKGNRAIITVTKV